MVNKKKKLSNSAYHKLLTELRSLDQFFRNKIAPLVLHANAIMEENQQMSTRLRQIENVSIFEKEKDPSKLQEEKDRLYHLKKVRIFQALREQKGLEQWELMKKFYSISEIEALRLSEGLE